MTGAMRIGRALPAATVAVALLLLTIIAVIIVFRRARSGAPEQPAG